MKHLLVSLLAALTIGGGAARAAAVYPPWEAGYGSTPLATGDFNGDGTDDLATGTPNEDVRNSWTSIADAGAVQVSYGGLRGPTQLWHQDSPGIAGGLEVGDRFGWSLAAGDFDGDGYDDLAIGVPFEHVDQPRAGMVAVLYGTKDGLSAAGDDSWTRGSSGVQGRQYDFAYFGWALAAGNFDGDAYDDLAIGAPGELNARGAVNVLFGRASGLGAARDQLWRQGTAGVDGEREGGDWFGASLAAGNLGYSSREDDLAIGSPGQYVAGTNAAGAVNVLYGQPGKGLTTTLVPDVYAHHGTPGVEGEPAVNANFGWSLAIADFGRLPQADLAVGAPGYASGGSVSVFYSTSYGVVPGDDELWRPGIGALPRAGRFGHALAVGDFNAVAPADLAIGAPLTLHQNKPYTGSAQVIYGSPIGLRTTGSVAVSPQRFTRTSFGHPVRGYDHFGQSLASGDFGRGVGAELVVGAPGVDYGEVLAQTDVGELYVLFGRAGGLVHDVDAEWSWSSLVLDADAEGESGDQVGG